MTKKITIKEEKIDEIDLPPSEEEIKNLQEEEEAEAEYYYESDLNDTIGVDLNDVMNFCIGGLMAVIIGRYTMYL